MTKQFDVIAREGHRKDWATPRQLFAWLDREFHFALDACATLETSTCSRFISEGALDHDYEWAPGPVWCNPPYGRKIGHWIEKAYRTATQRGITVVMLLPARTDTSWWHDFCLKGEIRFLRGRLEFDDAKGKRAPFPSAIVVFRGAQ